MKSLILFVFALLVSIATYAQIEFESGYFITESGQKITCYIKNVDWRNNPVKFDYKITLESTAQTGLLQNIKEFAIDNGAKYIGRNVKINKSTNKTGLLEDSRVLEFQNEKLFLKVLVEGPANLYYYEQGDLRRFFFNLKDNKIFQLGYKRYRKEPDNSYSHSGKDNLIGENNEFRQQLWNNFNCDGFKKSPINKIQYKIDPLIRLFNQYNLCSNPNYTIKEKTKTTFKLNVNIRPGINTTSLVVDNSFSGFRDVNFSQKMNLRVGVELEAILPFNQNKWAIIAEPTYHTYSNASDITVQSSFVQIMSEIKYTSLEIPIGLRHSMFLNDKFKLFINGSVLLDIPFSSEITYNNSSGTKAQLGFNASFVGGIGLAFNKFSFEGRYLGSREVFSSSEFISYISDYKGFSLILGYTIF